MSSEFTTSSMPSEYQTFSPRLSELNIPISRQFQTVCHDGQKVKYEIYLSKLNYYFNPCNSCPSPKDTREMQDKCVWGLKYRITYAGSTRTNQDGTLKTDNDREEFEIRFHRHMKVVSEKGYATLFDNTAVQDLQTRYQIYDFALTVIHHLGLEGLLNVESNCHENTTSLLGVVHHHHRGCCDHSSTSTHRIQESINKWREETKQRLTKAMGDSPKEKAEYEATINSIPSSTTSPSDTTTVLAVAPGTQSTSVHPMRAESTITFIFQ